MKTITKLSLLLAAIAALGAGTASAYDPQLQTCLALDRARETSANGRATTVAVYAGNRGLGRKETRAAKTESRFELRTNAHGQNLGVFVPVTK